MAKNEEPSVAQLMERINILQTYIETEIAKRLEEVRIAGKKVENASAKAASMSGSVTRLEEDVKNLTNTCGQCPMWQWLENYSNDVIEQSS